ncbi:MAG: putative hydroxypyruvate isomerase [Mycobacterium sp.]|nr:putative hydroxypyruvate isomerase [Mycobacterium sp.]
MTAAAYTVNCSILLTEIPLLDRPHAVREAGFDAVEFWWPFAQPVPADHEVDSFVRAITDAGVALTGLNFAAGDMPAGERGILSDPARSTEFRDNVDVAVGIAQTLGTKAFNALYGNRLDGLEPAEQDAAASENLAFAAAAAQRIGAVVLVEPVSGAAAYPLTRAADAVAVIDRVHTEHGPQNLRLLADLYHLHVNGDDVGLALDTYADQIGHVQIADAPGRGEPGTGTLDLPRYLDQLAQLGYRGYIGLEYKATRPDPFYWLPREQRSARAVASI